MSILARHKKPGGFRKLVQSMETTPPEKRNAIYKAMDAEDAEFVLHLKESLFSFEEFMNVPVTVITELVESMIDDIRIIAIALWHIDAPLHDKFFKNMLPHSAKRFKEASSELLQIKQFERTSAQFKMIIKARELEQNGVFILKRLSGHYPE